MFGFFRQNAIIVTLHSLRIREKNVFYKLNQTFSSLHSVNYFGKKLKALGHFMRGVIKRQRQLSQDKNLNYMTCLYFQGLPKMKSK